jgi:arsenical pump membrane protein
MSWQLVALLVAVVATLVPIRGIAPAFVAAAVARAAVVTRVVAGSDVREAFDALAAPLGFLLVAVPLAVVLDDVGFFSSTAALVGGGRHLRLGL